VPSPLGFEELRVVAGGWVQARIQELFPRTASLAAALVWARKEGLSPEVRESFARAGTAHLLAISGFHVGVVAGLLLLLMGLTGIPHTSRFILSSLGVWVYVLAIGVPAAAGRAALLISLLALGRGANRAVAPMGALATAFLGFLLVDPGAMLRPGFQLSFAGAFGLVTAFRPVFLWISTASRGRLPLSLCQGLAAGVSATLVTLPLVGWHFGRVSLIGIPLTLVVTPLIVLAIPGIFSVLLLSLVHAPSARFLASGVEPVLDLLLNIVGWAADLPFASVWVSPTAVGAGCGALILAGLVLSFRPTPGRGRRRRFLASAVVVGILVGPPLVGLRDLGVMELVVLDVGQGDAALLRSPGGRWVLVDAGPSTGSFDAGARTVLPYLRRRGVGELALLILTHPDMDHVGGAATILAEFPVGAVLDPGVPAGTDAFLEVLESAKRGEVPWRTVGAGDSLDLDGMALRVLSPEEPEEASSDEGRNGASLVLEVRFGAFAALLTGDAPLPSEARFLPRILSSQVQVLKVGHHGSATSTSAELLERVNAEAALISVGRGNRFGHPAPQVLARLERGGVRVVRTDRDGTLVVRARRNGAYTLSARYD
jgi:competence protein ComEC